MTFSLADPSLHRYIIGVLFLAAGFLHFYRPVFFLRIMPAYIPYHRMMVYISGVAEILGGGFLIFEFSKYWAGWMLILLLIAVFPANIEMARKAYRKHRLTPYTILLILRLPLQFALIYWVYWAAIIN